MLTHPSLIFVQFSEVLPSYATCFYHLISLCHSCQEPGAARTERKYHSWLGAHRHRCREHIVSSASSAPPAGAGKLPSLGIDSFEVGFYCAVMRMTFMCPYGPLVAFSLGYLSRNFLQLIYLFTLSYEGLPWWYSIKTLPANEGDAEVRFPGLGRSPGDGNATHSSILAWGIPWTGVWEAAVHGVAKSKIRLRD